MPDVSNEDLMKLIHRVIKKVDSMEEKLSQLYYMFTNKRKKQHFVDEDGAELDYEFRFSPIKNQEELDFVSKQIEEDESYRRNLRLLMQAKGTLKLEDIFTADFLFDYNQSGINGKKKLEGLAPFEHIFVYLKFKDGETANEIKYLITKELIRIKNRIHKRKSLQNKGQNSNESSKENESSTEQTFDKPFQCKTEAFVDMNDIGDTDEEDSIIDTKPGEIYIEETHEPDADNVYENCFDSDDFIPISNDEECEEVSLKIKAHPEYLKQLRLRMVEQSDDGQCTLEQLFTLEYLKNFNLFGTHENKKLVDLIPYKAVYFYLKKHLGLSLKEIELDAVNELRKVKNRLAARRKNQRKRGELPPFVKKTKKKN